ncbi:MAG: HAD family hydrolase [Spirochaetes bacterium]|nr:HAD family hydrolase [Spirochaetota bacterium]MBU0955922.1 HAD family hydrolase [Spirochaetota bacterium]
MTSLPLPGTHARYLAALTLPAHIAVGAEDSCQDIVLHLFDYVQSHGIAAAGTIEPGSIPQSSRFYPLLNPQLRLPRRPKVILFDIYGTLLASALGEVGADPATTDRDGPASETDAPKSAGGALIGRQRQQKLSCDGLTPFDDEFKYSTGFRDRLQQLIIQDHALSRAKGLPWPEVDSIDVFLRALNLPDGPAGRRLAAMACVRWECIQNPCSAMPAADSFLAWCSGRGLSLGIVSNAQFYTPLFLEAAFGSAVLDTTFDTALQQWSYLSSRAKPDTWMYEILGRALQQRGIKRQEVLFVGNDALNDCCAAREAGFMSCLFAGDARSLKLREIADQLNHKLPDIVVRSWPELQAKLTRRG